MRTVDQILTGAADTRSPPGFARHNLTNEINERETSCFCLRHKPAFDFWVKIEYDLHPTCPGQRLCEEERAGADVKRISLATPLYRAADRNSKV